MKILTVQMTNVLQLAVKVSEQTKADVFFEYAPHVNWFSVFVHLDGWEANGHKPDKRWDIRLEDKNAYKQLSEVYAYLKDILSKQKENRPADQSNRAVNNINFI